MIQALLPTVGKKEKAAMKRGPSSLPLRHPEATTAEPDGNEIAHFRVGASWDTFNPRVKSCRRYKHLSLSFSHT